MAQKATSNVFALFSQSQIQEFKEAFNMIDQDRNGFISKEDLAGMFSSMGKDPPETYLEDMIKEPLATSTSPLSSLSSVRNFTEPTPKTSSTTLSNASTLTAPRSSTATSSSDF